MNPLRVLRWSRARRGQVWRRVQGMVCLGVLCAWPWAPRVGAQTPTGGSGFAPGAREIFSLNLAQEPVGDFAKPISPSVTPLSGKLEVVEKDGQKMLRSAVESEFLITLPERLPERFTLEFDLITRASGYNNYELSFEGTPTRNRGPASAQITWRQAGVTLFGGRDAPTNLNPMPDDVQAEIEGQLAQVRAEFAGDNFTMYTNGRKIFTAPAVKFPRARVLRVGLYGFDAKQYAVHLARLRIADASTTMPAQPQGGILAANSGTGGGGQANQTNPANTSGTSGTSGPGAILAITGINVSVGAGGVATVTWNPLPVAATYFVVRWNANDPSCCNAMSPPGIPLTSAAWQDGVLPSLGTYVYRVIGKTANGTVEGETRFTYTGAPTPPPGVASTTPVPLTPSVPERITSYTPPLVSPSSPTAPPSSGSDTGAPAPSGGTVVTTPPPTAPFSSGPRTVSVYPEPTAPTAPAPTTTSTASGRTNVGLVGATGPGTIVGPEPAPTTTTTQPPSGSSIYVPPPAPNVVGSITPTQPSGGGGALPAPSETPALASTALYRVTLTGFAANTQTNDDVLYRDGIGDEIYGAAAVVAWDRKANVLKSYRFVTTPDYGDLGTIVAATGRIQAGTGGTKGGIVSGNKIPVAYDPAGTSIPPGTNDRFPLLLWDGPLTANVDTILIVPSLWERDTDKGLFNIYKTNWDSIYKTTVVNSGSVAKQVISAPLTSALMPEVRTVIAVGDPVSLTYKWISNTVGAGSDRPIGAGVGLGVLEYFDRVVVVTQEKVASLAVGAGTTLPLALDEPTDPALGGKYTLYVRVERTK